MKADVCLILEGTYPYVQGGVSSWIHRLVNTLDDITFAIIHLSSSGDVIKTPQYQIPSNIVEFREVFIHDFYPDKIRSNNHQPAAWKTIRKFYEGLGRNDFSHLEEFYHRVINKETRSVSINDLVFSRRSWNMMLEMYKALAPQVSFVDFFWTMRFIHIPLFNIFNAQLPDAHVYHTVCTGYAGLVSAIAKFQKKAPVLLTEHGIYTHERRIDISRANWIYTEEKDAIKAARSLGFFKDIWIKTFEILGKLTYEHADKIVTLFEGNRKMEIDDGADPSKISIIPNGVDVPAGYKKPAVNKKKPKTIGFVGRIVSIKDIKTFIRAMKIVQSRFPDVKIYILGSGEEEPDYYHECQLLADMLQLNDNIVFTGPVDVKEYYPKLDVVVLTSISEAQPLSVLEAMSYGVPVVTTNVGACEELVLGKSEEDSRLGPTGIITNVGVPSQTANAIISVLDDEEKRQKMSEACFQRVKKYYDVTKMIDEYKDLYESLLKQSFAEAETA